MASQVSLFFLVPGWSYESSMLSGGATAAENQVAGTILRSLSTRLIAILLLTLMIVLAVIAAIVVQSTCSSGWRAPS